MRDGSSKVVVVPKFVIVLAPIVGGLIAWTMSAGVSFGTAKATI